MKKKYPVSSKARSSVSYAKHVRGSKNNAVNKSTRKLIKAEIKRLIKLLK